MISNGTRERPFEKRPGADKPYSIAWADWLPTGETIASADWTIPAGLTKGAEEINPTPVTLDGEEQAALTVTTVRLSGGTIGHVYECSCEITTNATPPTVEARSLWIRMVPNYQ